MNKRIVLTKQSEGVHASLENHPEIWGCGQNTNEAIGSLISLHREVFGVDLGWDMDDVQTKMCLNDPNNAHKVY